MALLPLSLPPGIYRNGTEYQSKGRWYDCNLIRFFQGTIRPVGGWRVKSTSTVTGSPRAIIAWKDNSANTWAAIGTESNLYAMSRSGVVSNITPSGFTAGRADAIAGGGYGSGAYGAGTYGTPRADGTAIQDATVWSLDTWGEHLVGCTDVDGKIYEWSLNTSTAAVAVTNAPTAAAILVTQERIMMALGAAGIPRRVQWSDQEDDTDWTPTATNQAGDFDLQTNGRLMQGVRIKGGNLLLTDLDAHLASYTADILVYSFQKLADSCGAVSRNCAMPLDSRAVWMGNGGFWLYNGYVQPLPCDVSDYVFSDLNYQQASKIACYHNGAYGEVTWQYPSGSSNEIDRFVRWNYRENHWTIGSLIRFSGVDKGAFFYPLLCASDGYVYEHEVGFSYDTSMPFLVSGPIEPGNGDQIFYAQWLIPDELTSGNVTATFLAKFAPEDTEVSIGPYALSQRTDIRVCARQMKLRYDGVNPDDWRVGVPRIDIAMGGKR